MHEASEHRTLCSPLPSQSIPLYQLCYSDSSLAWCCLLLPSLVCLSLQLPLVNTVASYFLAPFNWERQVTHHNEKRGPGFYAHLFRAGL